MRNPKFNIDELISYLQGSCESLDAAIEELYEGMTSDDLTDKEFEDIDNWIFECAACGWWCETSEAHDGHMGQICTDCHEEELEQEDE